MYWKDNHLFVGENSWIISYFCHNTKSWISIVCEILIMKIKKNNETRTLLWFDEFLHIWNFVSMYSTFKKKWNGWAGCVLKEFKGAFIGTKTYLLT